VAATAPGSAARGAKRRRDAGAAYTQSRNNIDLAPFKAVEAALRTTTEFLARELRCPGIEPPTWSNFEWRIARAAAALQGISALLSDVLRWKGPDEWQAFLVEQKNHTLLRHQRITQLLARMDSRARGDGVAIVALKGAALHDLGLYRPGERPMGDIDLLVNACDLEAGGRLLKSIGYAESFTNRRHKVFEPTEKKSHAGLGEHIDNPINVEMHTGIAERLPWFEIDITALEFPAHARPGLNPYPSLAALMRHLLLHAAGNMRARALRHIQLHDIALLAGRMQRGDWQELIEAHAGERTLWWALPPLRLTARYYPDAIPPPTLAETERRCSRLLRQVSRRHELSDVSWSRLRIQAFPGIEWSRSPMEAAAFAASRVWPSRAALSELSEAVTVQPSLTTTPWYHQSHGRRILRWVFSRPPRVQTMFSVRAALEHER
jgi:hypothetical protein